ARLPEPPVGETPRAQPSDRHAQRRRAPLAVETEVDRERKPELQQQVESRRHGRPRRLREQVTERRLGSGDGRRYAAFRVYAVLADHRSYVRVTSADRESGKMQRRTRVPASGGRTTWAEFGFIRTHQRREPCRRNGSP